MRAGHEKRDFSPALLLKVGAGLLIVVVATMLITQGLRSFLSHGEDLNDHPTTPQLVVDKSWNLDSYGWVDREKQIVHIPIEQAMQMVVQGEQHAKFPDSGATVPPDDGLVTAGARATAGASGKPDDPDGIRPEPGGDGASGSPAP